MSHAKVQHYVPRMLLRGFTGGKKKHLFAFDKRNQKVFRTSPKRIAAETAFYDLEYGDYILTLEDSLQSLESKAAGPIKMIRRERSISQDYLSLAECAIVAQFAAVQYLRTRVSQQNISKSNDILKNHLESMGADLGGKWESSYDEAKAIMMSLISRQSVEFTWLLLIKHWMLIETNNRHPFFVSDHPFTMHNSRNFEFSGNIGFAVPGIEMYLPISSTLSLCMFCPTLIEGVEAAAQKGEPKVASESKEILDCIDAGTPHRVDSEEVEQHNSLQVAWSHRWLFSINKDFGLAKKMLACNPELAQGSCGVSQDG